MNEEQPPVLRQMLRELQRIRFRVGVCALIMALPFLVGFGILGLMLLGILA